MIATDSIIENGKGYIPANSNNQDEMPIGLIPIDALFSPIKKVAYRVDNTRVGQQTDYDKLLFDIETDGTLTVTVDNGAVDADGNGLTFDNSDIFNPGPMPAPSVNSVDVSAGNDGCLVVSFDTDFGYNGVSVSLGGTDYLTPPNIVVSGLGTGAELVPEMNALGNIVSIKVEPDLGRPTTKIGKYFFFFFNIRKSNL